MDIVIEQKMSGTGTIYDLASEHYDRKIRVGSAYNYAVVLPAYYNAAPTRHKTEEAAIRAYNRLKQMNYAGIAILSRDGAEMIVAGDRLITA
jgi:hypothetical protein